MVPYQKTDGEELSEMYDMYTGGALAFTDHLNQLNMQV